MADNDQVIGLLLQEFKHLRETIEDNRKEQKADNADLRREMKEEVAKLQKQNDDTNVKVSSISAKMTKWQGGYLVIVGIGAFGSALLTLWEKLAKLISV